MKTSRNYQETKRIGIIGENLQDNEIDQHGRRQISNALQEIFACWGMAVIAVKNLTANHGGWDFRVTIRDALGRCRDLRVEAKTDQVGARTKNHAVEISQDIVKGERGWYYYSKADVFVFVWTQALQPVRATAVWATPLKECVETEIVKPSAKFSCVPDKANHRKGRILCLPHRYLAQQDQSECVVIILDSKEGSSQ